MKIHEYQAKELLGSYGVPVPTGAVAETPEAAGEAARALINPNEDVTIIRRFGIIEANASF